ncbi:MAG: DUF2206 domain-containing protein [Methanobacterium sp.]
MINKLIKGISSIDARKWFLMVVLSLFLTDLIIILDISWLRSLIPFFYFTLVPGILILQIFRLNRLDLLKKFVLWIGLSISFLIFVGLLLNSLYPFIAEPLALNSVLLSFNIILLALAFLAYQRNKNDFRIGNINLNPKKLTSPLFFPVLFPFMAIIGTFLMNNFEDNTVLLAMLFLIIIYLVLVTFLRDRVDNAVYPLSLWMISMSLLLMNGLSSSHLMGRDIHIEFYCFQLTLDGFHWDISKFYDTFNACLSITVLPTIYQVLSNINSEYVFKLFFPLIGSIVPLIVYVTSKKYLEPKYAFFASLVLVSMSFFAFESMAIVRQMISLMFFFLAILVLFDDEIGIKFKKALFLIFMISVVVSHYSTAYMAFIFTMPILALPFLKSLLEKIRDSKKPIKFTNFDVIAGYLISLIAWYSLIAYIQVNKVSTVTSTITMLSGGSNAGTFLAENTTDSMVLAMLGIGLKSISNIISAFVHDALFITIGLGVIVLFWKYNYFKEKIESGFYVGIIVSIILIALFIFTPYISLYYGAERVFFQSLVFLAPVFVIGAQIIAKGIKRPRLDVIILLVLVISLFSCNTYLQYHLLGEPHSPFYEKVGAVRDEYYIHEQEFIAAKWLNSYRMDDLKIYSDAIGGSRLMLAFAPDFSNSSNFCLRGVVFNNCYIYLGYVATKKDTIYREYLDPYKREDYNYSFKNKSKIYDNDGSEVYFG